MQPAVLVVCMCVAAGELLLVSSLLAQLAVAAAMMTTRQTIVPICTSGMQKELKTAAAAAAD